MKVLSNSSRRSQLSEDLASQPIGGVREFATFAVLILCFAVTVAIVSVHRHRAAKRPNAQATTSAHRAIVPNPRQSDAIAFGHGHKALDAAKSKAATTTRGAVAPSPNPQPNAPVAPGEEYTAWAYSAAGNLGTSAVSVQNVVLDAIISLVWDPAVGLSNQIIGFVSDSSVNSVTGDRIIFNGAPGASQMAASILAFAMVGVVMLALAGPLYASWKTWRLSRAHGYRNRAH